MMKRLVVLGIVTGLVSLGTLRWGKQSGTPEAPADIEDAAAHGAAESGRVGPWGDRAPEEPAIVDPAKRTENSQVDRSDAPGAGDEQRPRGSGSRVDVQDDSDPCGEVAILRAPGDDGDEQTRAREPERRPVVREPSSTDITLGPIESVVPPKCARRADTPTGTEDGASPVKGVALSKVKAPEPQRKEPAAELGRALHSLREIAKQATDLQKRLLEANLSR